MTVTNIRPELSQNPFAPGNQEIYLRWQEQKLADYPESADQLIVEVKDPRALSRAEKQKITELCQKTNMVIYQSKVNDGGKDVPRLLGRQMGLINLDPNMLADEDGITSLELMPAKHERGYIPYTDRRLLWHTDGYYNDASHRIAAMLLHCVRPALSGGENSLLDHEMAYLLLHEQDPAHIKALMDPDAMTIPANLEASEVERPARTGPVFSANEQGLLSMRYTARIRSITWKDNTATKTAVQALVNILDSDCKYIFHHRLEAGQGIICNNVLHNRTSFKNGESSATQRLIYRARYYDRINKVADH
ncbi:MAG: TauD/TfdA family dioxygenase [Acidiferrobacterales bacterium]